MVLLLAPIAGFAGNAHAGEPDPATVTLALSTRRVVAGTCLGATITVSPDRTGQQAQLQRRTRNGWRTIDAQTLASGSETTIRACFGWSDLGGRVRLRARWPQQDAGNTTGTSAVKDVAVARAGWMRRIDRLTAGRSIGVSVGSGSIGGDPGVAAFLYRRADARRRTPASNEKLLLSMALLDRLGPQARVATKAGATRMRGGTVGTLWITGAGDPEVGRAKIRSLADRLVDAGLRRVRRRVLGNRGGFARDWWARGWKRSYRRLYIPLPTALTWQGNRVGGRHIRDPERRAAAALTERLRQLGVRVGGRAGAGRPGGELDVLAQVGSAPVVELLRRQNVHSKNFHAEVLGKALGAARAGPPGTIAKGARAIEAFTRRHHVRTIAWDASGLSSRNRVAPGGIVRLLWVAEDSAWYQALRTSLPSAGQGTLKGRMHGIGVRAKTGTLSGISALSGWVWLDLEDRWVAFSILSRGMPKPTAAGIEDRIVHAIATGARVAD